MAAISCMAMKMTMHIDEALLAEVMEIHHIETKTEAVEFALRELVRRTRLRKIVKEGLDIKPEDWTTEEEYNLAALRVADTPGHFGSPDSKD